MIASGPVGPTQTRLAVRPVAAGLARPDDAAERYERYVAAFARPFATRVVDAVIASNPRVVLDHGAGTGLVTRLLHRQCPMITVYALDPSASLLTGLADEPSCVVAVGVSADLERLHPGLRVDAVASSLSLMFCPTPTDDLLELRAHTISGGSLVVSVLGASEEIEAFWCYWSAVRSVVSSAWHPAVYPHHRFADPERLRWDATAAGWEEAAISCVTGRRRLSSAQAWKWLNGALPVGDGPGYIELDATVRERIRTEFETRWGPKRTVRSRGWLLRSVNPG